MPNRPQSRTAHCFWTIYLKSMMDMIWINVPLPDRRLRRFSGKAPLRVSAMPAVLAWNLLVLTYLAATARN